MADYVQRLDYGVSSQSPTKPKTDVTNQNGSMADSGFEPFDFVSSKTPSPEMTSLITKTSNGHDLDLIPFDPLQTVEENGDPPLLDLDYFDPLAPLPMEEFLSPSPEENNEKAAESEPESREESDTKVEIKKRVENEMKIEIDMKHEYNVEIGFESENEVQRGYSVTYENMESLIENDEIVDNGEVVDDENDELRIYENCETDEIEVENYESNSTDVTIYETSGREDYLVDDDVTELMNCEVMQMASPENYEDGGDENDEQDERRQESYLMSKDRDSGADCDSLDDEIQHQQYMSPFDPSMSHNASVSPHFVHDDSDDKNQKIKFNNTTTYTSAMTTTISNGVGNKKGKKTMENVENKMGKMEKKTEKIENVDAKVEKVDNKLGKTDNKMESKIKRSKSERNVIKGPSVPIAEKENVVMLPDGVHLSPTVNDVIIKQNQTNSHAIVGNDQSDYDKNEKDAPITTGVDVKQLTQTYRQISPHQQCTERSREKIETGISIRDLRTRYNKDGVERLATKFTRSMGDLSRVESRNQEFHLGVSVQALRASYCDLVRIEETKCRVRTKVDTGVSICNLKSTFSNDTTINNNINNGTQSLAEQPGIKIDRAKITRSFSQDNYPLYALLDANDGVMSREEHNNLCRICGRPVFLMDRIKAEKCVFHRTCFRCKECNKQLTVDSYCSHESVLYCKLHFKQLFQPKAKFEENGPHIPRRKPEETIKENIPMELPADVVRSCDKPDYGLEEIPSLQNIKSRFESGDFEADVTANNTADITADFDNSETQSPVKRSGSILNKMARFQNGFENGDKEEESEEDETDQMNGDIVKESRKKEKLIYTAQDDEQEVVFQGMNDLKNQWEKGATNSKEEEWARETQEELNKLRQKICQGKGNVKALYENAVQDVEKSPIKSPSISAETKEIRSIAEKWERGELLNESEQEKLEQFNRDRQDDLNVFKESGTSVEARNIFKKMDETIVKTGVVLNLNKSPLTERSHQIARSPREPSTDTEIIRSTNEKEEIVVDSTKLHEKFQFFENYQDPRNNQERKRFTITPPRDANDSKLENDENNDENGDEIDRDPNIIRSGHVDGEDVGNIAGDVARKMLDKFRQLEQGQDEISCPAPKPLKRITPPRDYVNNSHHYDNDDEEEEENEPERNPEIIRSSDKIEEVMSMETRSLRAKFENWTGEEEDNYRRDDEDDEQPSIDTTKNLKAKFEAMQLENNKGNYGKNTPGVKRFVEQSLASSEQCSICNKRVYAMEKMEANNQRIHKSCFKCSHCSCPLRLDNYTFSEGIFYCSPHFKQLFITRGNYDEGFGREQHKEKWNRSRSTTPTGNMECASDVTQEMYA